MSSAGRKKTRCTVCKKKRRKCPSNKPGCHHSEGSGSGVPVHASTVRALARAPTVPQRLTYTHSNHSMQSEEAHQKRRNNKRKEEHTSSQESAQKKQAPALPKGAAASSALVPKKMSLASFFSRPPHKNLDNVAKAVASAVRAAGKVQQAEAAEAAEAVPKKRGGNSIAIGPVKKLKTALSKGHSIEKCKGIVDTSKPVKEARLK